jgi:hypothetical protein
MVIRVWKKFEVRKRGEGNQRKSLSIRNEDEKWR